MRCGNHRIFNESPALPCIVVRSAPANLCATEPLDISFSPIGPDGIDKHLAIQISQWHLVSGFCYTYDKPYLVHKIRELQAKSCFWWDQAPSQIKKTQSRGASAFEVARSLFLDYPRLWKFEPLNRLCTASITEIQADVIRKIRKRGCYGRTCSSLIQRNAKYCQVMQLSHVSDIHMWVLTLSKLIGPCTNCKTI